MVCDPLGVIGGAAVMERERDPPREDPVHLRNLEIREGIQMASPISSNTSITKKSRRYQGKPIGLVPNDEVWNFLV